MHGLWFFMRLSISGKVNNIKIICSIRFSLFITIDRFYKLFSCRGCFRESSTWDDPPSLFHTDRPLSGSLCSPPSPRGEGFVRRYSFSTYACIRFDDARKAVSSYRSLPHGGNAIKLSGRTFLAPHRGSSPKGWGGYVAVLHESVGISMASDYST